MCAPKCPGSEVREEYKRGFGVPTLIAVHPENDPNGVGLAQAKAYAVATGGHRAGVLRSSFVAEVKSDLMGEQTILCGLCYKRVLFCVLTKWWLKRRIDARLCFKIDSIRLGNDY